MPARRSAAPTTERRNSSRVRGAVQEALSTKVAPPGPYLLWVIRDVLSGRVVRKPVAAGDEGSR